MNSSPNSQDRWAKRGARVEAGRLTVSSIYVWFEEDFGGSDESVIEHLRRYADPPLAAALRSVRSIDDDAYDWSLKRRQVEASGLAGLVPNGPISENDGLGPLSVSRAATRLR